MLIDTPLRLGSAGPDVELLQLGLYRCGYLRERPDGIFGNMTRSALLAFQKSYGLVADAVAGPMVFRAISPYLYGYFRHRIIPGDTLYKIADNNGIELSILETANPSVDALDLRPGEFLTVPFSFEVVPDSIKTTSKVLEICLTGLKARYPFLREEMVGRSVMGNPIRAVTIGEGTNEVFYNASHHANEWITSLLLLRFLERYASAYALGSRIAEERAAVLYSSTKLLMIPMVNPDGVDLVTGALDEGRYYRSAAGIASDYPSIPFPDGWKANIAGVDPNLQYPAGWEQARKIKYAQGYTSPAPRDFVGPGPLTAPESLAVYSLTNNHDFMLTISYHSQGEVIYWTYNETAPPASEEIVREFSRLSGYAAEITPPGSDNAGYKDWFISTYNRPGFTVEVGTGRSPLPLTQFNEIWRDNLGILVHGMTAAAQILTK